MEQQLRQAHKMEAIGTLAGGIAHDFNNILGIIMGYTELLLCDNESDRELRRNSLEQIRKASHRAQSLVKQILAFSRQREYDLVRVNLSELIEETLPLIRAALPTTIQIKQNFDLNECFVMADATQLHQVLMNLCANAKDAMTENGGALGIGLSTITFEPHDLSRPVDLHPGVYARISVSDTGEGIDKKTLERIFEPFFTTKEIGKGTGMGLAMVHGIVKNHGGAVTVYSEVDRGTIFHVYLPIFSGSFVKMSAPGDDPLVNNHSSVQGRILFVDDEESLVATGKRMLEMLGYSVVACTSSLAAFAEFRRRPNCFDLVITDQTMPQMTGLDLFREMRNIQPDIPVIVTTGFSESMNPGMAADNGISALLMKPVTMRDLARSIKEALS